MEFKLPWKLVNLNPVETSKHCRTYFVYIIIFLLYVGISSCTTSLAVSITLTLLLTAVITTIISSLVTLLLTKRCMHYEIKQEDKFVKQPPPAVYEENSSSTSVKVSSNPAYGQVNIK